MLKIILINVKMISPFLGVRLPRGWVAVLGHELEGGRDGAGPVGHVVGGRQDNVESTGDIVLKPRT